MNNSLISSLKDIIRYWETIKMEPSKCEELITMGELKSLLEGIDQLNNTIDKAIEFNKYVLNGTWYGGNEKIYAQRNLNILQGSDKE